MSTGTGSTSWHTSINRLSKKNVEDLLKILSSQSKVDLKGIDAEEISDVYNQRLVFEPGMSMNLTPKCELAEHAFVLFYLFFQCQDDPRLCYSIREQICVGVWPNPKGMDKWK